MPATTLSEAQLPGPIPRYELTAWRSRHGIVAGITGREFDLGLWTGQPVGEVMGRWRALRAAEPGFSTTVLGNQVHATEVAGPIEGTGWIQLDGVDGHVTATPGVMLTVTVADCIPVYLLQPRQPAVALLHSGWRGTAGGILERGVERLLEVGGGVPSDIVMHCGVGICGDCYEVGSEVMTGCGRPAEGAGPWHLDLRQLLAERAGDIGIQQVSVSPWCSGHDAGRFYSHRRSRGGDGRMVAYLGIPARNPAA
jgi:hypothetical protein